MTFADVLLWMAGVSWLLTAVTAISRARGGDLSLLRYFAAVAVVAGPLALAFPAASAWILGLAWILTLVIPSLLAQRIRRLIMQRRFTAAQRLILAVRILHPVGPLAVTAAIQRYQCLRETGRTEEAQAVAAGFPRFPAPLRRQAEMVVLASDQRWPEVVEHLRGRPTSEAGMFRLRALGEVGDLVAMLDELPACAEVLEQQRVPLDQALGIVLAFAGRPELARPLLTAAAPAIQTFWLATARWAAGEPDAARALLDGLRDPSRPVLDAAIAWRVAHPPAEARTMDPVLRARFDHLAGSAALLVGGRAARPWLTWAILATCVAMFVVTGTADDDFETLWRAGAFDTALGWAGNWWRFIAASFLHISVIHLAMNGLGLLFFAPTLERAMGRLRFPMLYLLAGAGGMALVQLLDQFGGGRSIVVGASAAIMGLIGAELVRVIRARLPGDAWWRQPQVRRIGLMLTIQVVFDLSHPVVSQSAHIGGFLSGLALGWLLVPRPAPGSGPAPAAGVPDAAGRH